MVRKSILGRVEILMEGFRIFQCSNYSIHDFTNLQIWFLFPNQNNNGLAGSQIFIGSELEKNQVLYPCQHYPLSNSNLPPKKSSNKSFLCRFLFFNFIAQKRFWLITVLNVGNNVTRLILSNLRVAADFLKKSTRICL